MNGNKIGEFIKKARKKDGLTQSAFAEKYNVSFQAVSKWENGKNIPDIILLKQICNDYDTNINDILDGVSSKKKVNKKLIIIGLILLVIIGFGIFFIIKGLNNKKEFEFKQISSGCELFHIYGTIAYSKNNSNLYLTNISYCSGNDDTLYQKIECILYEKDGNTEVKLSSVNYEENEKILLEKFLEGIEFNLDHFSNFCKNYDNDSLFLQINATDENEKTTSYRVPLSLGNSCRN